MCLQDTAQLTNALLFNYIIFYILKTKFLDYLELLAIYVYLQNILLL